MIEGWFYSVDWELFSQIATPVISFLAFIVYGAALYTSMKQNKITASTSLIPYYDEEIQNFVRDKKEVGFFEETLDALYDLNKNTSYIKDLQNGELGAGLSLKSLTSKPYNFHLIWIYPVLNDQSEINMFYRRLESFIKEIDRSKLVASHKLILKRKIRRQVAMDLFILRFRLNEQRSKIPSRLPAPMITDMEGESLWVAYQLKEIDFFQRMDRLEKMLTLN